jgi:F420-0:gamma-glutamyl ligase
MGKATGIPAAIVRGVNWQPSEAGIAPLIRPPDEDLFR